MINSGCPRSSVASVVIANYLAGQRFNGFVVVVVSPPNPPPHPQPPIEFRCVAVANLVLPRETRLAAATQVLGLKATT